jgi:hypothetical protein
MSMEDIKVEKVEDYVDPYADPDKVAYEHELIAREVAQHVAQVEETFQAHGGRRMKNADKSTWTFKGFSMVAVHEDESIGLFKLRANTADGEFVVSINIGNADLVLRQMAEICAADEATVTVDGEEVDLPVYAKLHLFRHAHGGRTVKLHHSHDMDKLPGRAHETQEDLDRAPLIV